MKKKKAKFSFTPEDAGVYKPKRGDIIVQITDGTEGLAEIYVAEVEQRGLYAVELAWPYSEFWIPPEDYHNLKKKGQIKYK